MKNISRILSLFLLGIFIAGLSYADIARIETKRERMQREKRESPGRSNSDAYLKIHENFLKENYSEVNHLAEDYLGEGMSRPNSEDVLYLQALSLLKINRAAEARVKLAQLEGSFADPNRKASASASIADSYFYEGNYSQAYLAYQETMRKYPDSEQTAYIQFKLNELSDKLGKPREYNTLRPAIKNDIAQTPVAAPAKTWKQISMEEAPVFTVQIGSFSKVRNANALMNKLYRRQYDAYIDHDRQSGMYRVRVGHFPSKNEAATLESRLKSEGYPTKIYP